MHSHGVAGTTDFGARRGCSCRCPPVHNCSPSKHMQPIVSIKGMWILFYLHKQSHSGFLRACSAIRNAFMSAHVHLSSCFRGGTQQVRRIALLLVTERRRLCSCNHALLLVVKSSRFSLTGEVRVLFPFAPVQAVDNLVDPLGHGNLLHLLVVLEADLRSRQRSEGPSAFTCTQAMGLLDLYIIRQDMSHFNSKP